MKKIIMTILVVIIVFLIYSFNVSEKTYYVSLGDQLAFGINNFDKINNNYSDNIKNNYKKTLKKYVNYSTLDDYRVMDLINDINYNKVVNYKNSEYKLQNLLIKANLITISIGMNDLIYKKDISYDYVDDLLDDINNLFNILRKYNKDQIYFLSFYNIINNEEIIDYANDKLKNICKKNKINYVDISKLDSYIIKGIYPTNDGYTYITDKILTLLNS